MNVTPLIDVLLVLLIIFMVITPTTPHGLQSQLPQGQPQPTATEAPVPLVVELAGTDAAPTYLLNRQTIAEPKLQQTLTAAFSTRQQRVLFVRAARDLTFQPVAALVATARGAGATTIALDDPSHPLF
jgi:biopolymer transport protein ExbD